MKTGVIIQARMGSSRLPGKVMMDLCGRPVIWHVCERLKKCNEIDEIIVATTTSDIDDVLFSYLQSLNVKSFRGSEEDVLSRYYFSAIKYDLDIVVRVTADCPLIDPIIIDNLCKTIKNSEYPMVTNIGTSNVSMISSERTFPRGLDTEVFKLSLLEDAHLKATEKYQREHVTPYMYQKYINIYNLKNSNDYSMYRWTLDTIEDYELILIIYEHFFKEFNHNFYMHDIIKFMEDNSYLIKINEKIEQKKISIGK